MKEQLEKEFGYYLAHQAELVKLHNGKFIVIKNCQVIGVYDSEYEAITETAKQNELGTFLVQKCEPGTDNYMQMYHSRVAFV
jgi:hypothetical protein